MHCVGQFRVRFEEYASNRRDFDLRILLVEDEPELANATVSLLSANGFVVDHAACLGEAIQAVMGASYRAVLVDRRLPDGDGLSLLPVIRTRPVQAPAIVLTAMDELTDRIAGFDAGAEDYLIKPFEFEELLARLRVILRRSSVKSEVSNVKLGNVHYNFQDRQVQIGYTPVVLPRRELALFDALIRQAGRVVLRENLENNVYGFDDEIQPNAFDATVSRLRRRLADQEANVTLHVIRGVGYMLRVGK